jgi:molybdate transport system permease protein
MTLPPDFWQALWLTIRLAATTTLLLLLIGLPIAQWLARAKGRIPLLVEVLFTLPIVLPPTVIGFYLLVIFAPQTFLGGLWMRLTGHPLAFSFAGLVAGSVIYSLPFAIQPFRAGLAGVPRDAIDASRICGASAFGTFWHVTLPLAWSSVAVGAVLSFAHTLGEFGVVLMIGGSIPGKTRVISILLYDEVQKMDYATAHACSAVLLVVAFILIFAVTVLRRHPAE